MTIKILLMSLVLTASNAFAGFQLTTEEKLSDFDQLNAQIEAHYGPKLYKKDVLKLNLDGLRSHYREQIRQSTTNSAFYYAMVQYVAEFKDGHFGIGLPTDYTTSIPVFTDLVEGRVLIEGVDRLKLSATDFPFTKGDEILSLDGVSSTQLLDELSKYIPSGNPRAIRRKAAMVFFRRASSIFPAPKNKTVTVEIRRNNSSTIETIQLKWDAAGSTLDEIFRVPVKKTLMVSTEASASRKNYDMLSTKEAWQQILGDERLERSFQCSGKTRTVIPKDATVLMRDPFVAYYHPTAKGNVGYLRIPHYMPPAKPGTAQSDVEGYFRRYEWAIAELEKNTVGLVIDQDHNCGGSVSYLHQIVSLFMSKPFKPMQFELRASKAEYMDFANWLKNGTTPNSIEEQNLKRVAGLIKAHWEKGDYLTAKTSIDGEELIYPNRIYYTKPIVVLIDELSGSGGDAFPAMMQGLGRATLIGSTTAGLGGHVNQTPSLNYSGMVIRMTQSLFYRPDGVAVENNGAVPDVQYTPTRDDFIYEYKNYQQFYLNVLLSKI